MLIELLTFLLCALAGFIVVYGGLRLTKKTIEVGKRVINKLKERKTS